MAPEFSKAAKTLEKENIFLAQVDCTVQKKLAKRFGIHGYPTMKLFSKGKEYPYRGKRTEGDIVSWMRKRTSEDIIKSLTSEKEIEEFKQSKKICLIYFGDNKEELNEIEAAVLENEDLSFGQVTDNNLFGLYNVSSGQIVLYKKYDELQNIYQEKKIRKDYIEHFFNQHSVPLVVKQSDKAYDLIMKKKRPSVILFRNGDDAKAKELDEIMTRIADKFKGKPQIIITDIKSESEAKLAKIFGIKKAHLPTLRGVEFIGHLRKFKYEKEITYETVNKFIEDWRTYRTEPYVISEEVPKEQTGPVYKLVGNTFNKEVIQSDKDVLVKFYGKLNI